MYLFWLRSNTLFTTAFPVVPGFGSPISVPIVRAFDHEKPPFALRPRARRCVTLICSASYQVFPIGFQYTGIVVNCGNGLKACARVRFGGNPTYGTLKPRLITSVVFIPELSSLISAGLVTSRPNVFNRSGVFAFKF